MKTNLSGTPRFQSLLGTKLYSIYYTNLNAIFDFISVITEPQRTIFAGKNPKKQFWAGSDLKIAKKSHPKNSPQ